MKTFFVLIFMYINFCTCIEKYSNIQDALKNYPNQDKKHGKQPKFVYFHMNKNKAKDIDYFSKILYQFMNTMGVRPYFVNLQDSQLLGIVPKEANIDVESLMENFGDVINKIEIKDEMDK